jgi:hypothetical protein
VLGFPIARRSTLIAAAILAVVAGSALVLALANNEGTVSGHVYYCVNRPFGSAAAAACNPGEPVAHTGVLFERVDSHQTFLSETDSGGGYSISLAAGTYAVKYRILGTAEHNDAGHIYIGDWGVKPISLVAHQHVVLNLTTHALAQ